MKTIITIIAALIAATYLMGCTTTPPPDDGYELDTTPTHDGETWK
jgi:ABC-type uncharacterized transport system auxiliary subunit